MRKIRLWMPAGIASPNVDLILRGSSTVAENIALTEVLARCYEGTISVGLAAGSYNINLLTGANEFGGDEIQIGATDNVTYEAHSAVDWSNVLNQSTPVNLSQTKIGGYVGEGAWIVTITVRDAVSLQPILNALVRLSRGLASYSNTTNSSGIVTFSLDSNTYNVSITRSGYSFTPTTLIVAADLSQTYDLSAFVIAPPANPALSTGFVYCYDTQGAPEEGVSIIGYMVDGPGATAQALDSEGFEMISGADGLATYPLLRLATYKFRRGSGKEVYVVAADADATPLPELLGYD